MKKIISIVLASIMLVGGIFVNISASADTTSKFYFNGSMSKEVLRNYVSRAVSHQCLAVNANKIDPLFEEDLRMLRRIGAKYIGRAATYSWAGNLNKNQIEYHYTLAKEQAAKIHAADPEMILQAGIFEIVYKGTVNATAVPDYVFEAFDQPVESRNFDFKKMVFPKGTIDEKGEDRGIGSWGSDQSGVPDIAQLETKMYFYNQITKYIDAGFEAFHMGQAEMMMLYRGNTYASHWDELLTKARAYAKKHARRGVALFDYHSDITSGGIKVEDRLIFDVQGAGAVPNETKIEEGAMMAELTSASDCWLSWIGRSEGGIHPLGFEIESNFTIVEFDNYGGNGNPGVATPNAFYNWGFDDITWFAIQPEWYRNQFLLESAEFLKSVYLDSEGNQQYFLQPATLRNVTPEGDFVPQVIYTPGDNFSIDYVFDYANKTNSALKYSNVQNKFLLIVNTDYRANRNSDVCPNGFGQEDTIREIFLGKGVPEDPELLKVVLPEGYTPDKIENEQNSSTSSNTSSNNTSSNNTSSDNTSSEDKGASIYPPHEDTSTFDDITPDSVDKDGSNVTISSGEVETSTVIKTLTKKVKGESNKVDTWILIVIGVVAVLVGGAATFFTIWLISKKKRAKTV